MTAPTRARIPTPTPSRGIPAQPETLNPFRVLARHRNFRLFWFGQTLSLIGSWMQVMAQGWLALELTDNAFLVGAVAAAGSFPILLFSLHAGVVVDRYDKLRLVTISQVLLLLEAAVLWWMVWSGHITIAWLLILATVNGAVGAVEIPARQSLMIELVGRRDLREAIALNSSGFNLARILGPMFAAFVIGAWGIAWCFGLNSLSYVAVIAGLLMIRRPPFATQAAPGSPVEAIVQGVRYMVTTHPVATLMGMVTVFAVFGAPYLALMPVVARELLHLGAAGYGGLLICVGVGGVVGALGLAAIGDRIRRGRLLAISSFAFPAALLAFSLSRNVYVSYALLVVTGFMMIVQNALGNAILQSLVPDHLRGRLMAAYSFVVVGLSQVVGALVAGAVARVIGVQWAIGGAAVVILLYAWTVYTRNPQLTKV